MKIENELESIIADCIIKTTGINIDSQYSITEKLIAKIDLMKETREEIMKLLDKNNTLDTEE